MTIHSRLRGHDLEQRRRRVFAAWSRGKHQDEIADAEGVNQAQISRDLNAVLERMAAKDSANAQKKLARMLGKLAHAERELLAAWERSKQPKKRDKAARTISGAGPVGEEKKSTEIVTEGRDGNAVFWERLTNIWALEAKLLGLVTLKTEVSGPGGKPISVKTESGPDWSKATVEELKTIRAIQRRITGQPETLAETNGSGQALGGEEPL